MRAYGLPVRYLLRFLSYLIAAFQMLEPALGNVALAMLHTPQPPSLEAVLTILANDLVSHQRGAFTIVLYDYHLITAQPIHHTLDFLIEHFPLLMHLVIVTRVDPPLPLVRLRSHQRFTELGVPDLHFGQAEVREFLHLAMRVDLPPDIIDVLLDRTEGWVAGLQLAALSLRDCVDISAFLASFTGRHYAVFDYLSEEVLTRQPATVQSFLFSTCLLEHLCASLCDAVTGQTEGAAILERLGRDNIILLSLDDERQWYRYHQLFAEVLRNRLRQSQPLLVPELHRRASTWYEQHGFLPDAVEHARAAHDICGANNA